MKASIITLALAGALGCGGARNTPRPTDHAKLQGVWLAQTESQNGTVKKVTYQYVFTGDEVSFTDETGKVMKYSFTLETASNPRLLKIRPEETPADSAPVSVAYALAGDSLTIVVAPSGSRPTEMSDRNNQELIICTRKGP